MPDGSRPTETFSCSSSSPTRTIPPSTPMPCSTRAGASASRRSSPARFYGSRFGLDVAIGERMALPPEILSGSDAFAFAGIPPVQVRAYAREVHVAEKLHALTLPRSRPNSRVKDLPDIALLATTGPFRSDTLRQAIEATFASRGTHALPTSLGEPPELWRGAYGYMAQENRLPWGSLDEVLGPSRRSSIRCCAETTASGTRRPGPGSPGWSGPYRRADRGPGRSRGRTRTVSTYPRRRRLTSRRLQGSDT